MMSTMVRTAAGCIEAIGCAAFEWATREGLAKRKFPPADESLLSRLVDTGPLWR